MKPEEVLSDINSESIVRVGDDQRCLTLSQFRKIITTASIAMKISYIESLVSQGYVCLVDDMNNGFKKQAIFLSDGIMISSDGKQYKFQESGEPFTVSDFQWFNSGEICKILQPGEDWQEGEFRLRISAEFIPKDVPADRPTESSLDDFREIS